MAQVRPKLVSEPCSLDRDEPVQQVLPVNRRNLLGKVTMREPAKIGHFSIKKGGPNGPRERRYFDDDSELKVISLPKELDNVRLNLKDGYIPLGKGGHTYGLPTNAGLTELLKWILIHRDRFSIPSSPDSNSQFSLNTDFISYRGTFTQLMAVPYERFEDLLITAQLYKGTIYMNLSPTEEKLAKEDQRDDFLNALCHGGFRFEEYISVPAKQVATTNTCTENYESPHNDELCCVVRTRLKNHSLVYGAEMDCAMKDCPVDQLKLSEFVEIKTTKSVNNQRQYENFCRKMYKWWAQSYLIGISELVCGYRDDDMMCRKIERFNINDFPKMCSQYWSHIVCLNFMEQFLTFVKNTIKSEEETIFKFYWKPGQDVVCHKSHDKNFDVVPNWYKEAIEKN